MSSKAATSTTETGATPGSGASSGLEAATVAVLMGGRSNEREVSLVSGRDILRALVEPTDAADRRGPRRALGIELLPDGRWLVNGHALPVGTALHALAEVDVFFSGLHGGEGEGGAIQGLLTTAGFAFTGSDVRGSAVVLDKVFSRDLVHAQGLRVARGRAVDLTEWREGPDRVLDVLGSWAGSGWAVKPRCGGSSLGASLVRNPTELPAALERAFAEEPEALVEQLIEGTELTGGVVCDPAGRLRALTPVEIQPHAGRFFDYEEKYSESGAVEVCPPATVSDAVCAKIRHQALVAHRTLRCQGYSRTDFLLPRDEDDPVYLETNTLPGMTPRSLLPQAAAAEEIDYRTLCLWIASEALRRHRAHG